MKVHLGLFDFPLERGSAGRLAWAIASAAIVSAVLGFVLEIYFAVASGDSSRLISHVAFNPFVTAAYALVGVPVAARHTKNPIGWIFLAVSAIFALNILGSAYGDILAAMENSGVLPSSGFAEWMDIWFWLPAIILPTVYVFLLFPDGRLLSPRWRIVSWSAALGLVLTSLALALHPGPLESWATGPNPYGVAGAEELLEGLLNIGGTLLGVGFIGGVAAFFLRYRRSQGIERKQMKWLAYALVLLIAGFIAQGITWYLWPDNALVTELGIALSNLTLLGIAAAASVAILRYRLYDIDLVINRTLVYALLTGIIVLIYGLVLGGLGVLFQTQSNTILSLFATILIAILFQPLRNSLQRAVNRVFYGQRDDPLGALSQLGRRLESAMAPGVVLPTLVETIAHTLRLPYVAILIRTGDGYQLAAQAGVKAEDSITFPLVYQGETIGQLIASPRAPGEAFNHQDLPLLENIALQAGPAVHAVQLTAELQRSRLRLVSTREEERRRLRRDLHDGLGATLAALHLETGVLRRSIREDPDKAEALAEEFKTEIRAAIDDIRRLVYELRPPMLDQLGLVAAVRAHAAQYNRSSGNETKLQIEIHAPEELPPLPAAVEVAAYRVFQEALTNVVHHSHARRCQVRISMGDALILEVEDDGVGFPSKHRIPTGLGLLSMHERAQELGGSCVIEPSPGKGTRVVATLPLLEV